MRTMLLIVSVAAVALQTPAPYLITHTYNVGGDGSWDYIVPDPPNHRLFIGGRIASWSSTKTTGPCSAK